MRSPKTMRSWQKGARDTAATSAEKSAHKHTSGQKNQSVTLGTRVCATQQQRGLSTQTRDAGSDAVQHELACQAGSGLLTVEQTANEKRSASIPICPSPTIVFPSRSREQEVLGVVAPLRGFWFESRAALRYPR